MTTEAPGIQTLYFCIPNNCIWHCIDRRNTRNLEIKLIISFVSAIELKTITRMDNKGKELLLIYLTLFIT